MNEGKRLPKGVTPALEVRRVDAQKRRSLPVIKNVKIDLKEPVK